MPHTQNRKQTATVKILMRLDDTRPYRESGLVRGHFSDSVCLIKY